MAWDATFEGTPDGTDSGDVIDDRIQELKVMIRKFLNMVAKDTNGNAIGSGADEDAAVARHDVPEGSIMAWLPGYFTNGSNGGYTGISISLSDNWKLCDGSALNDSQSTIFNGAGRYLPQLTDDRFLMGDVTGSRGGTGGSSTMAHTHTGPSHSHTIPAHSHTLSSAGWALLFMSNAANTLYCRQKSVSQYTSNIKTTSITVATETNTPSYGTELDGATDSGGSGNTGSGGTGSTGPASNTENRPKYLSVSYIMKVRA